MTTLFYAPAGAFANGLVTLPEEEARHASRVLRHGAGDEIEVVDGEGGRHRVRLTTVDRQRVSGQVIESRRDVNEPAVNVTIGLALLKNPNRFETFVEKAVELGVRTIIPLVTERTERQRFKRERLQKIMIAAMKQSGRCVLPDLLEATPLAEILHQPEQGLRFICHEVADSTDGLLSRLAGARPGSMTLLVGPEGGFGDAEVAEALQLGWEVVSLGNRRLRAETAAIVGATAVALAYGD